MLFAGLFLYFAADESLVRGVPARRGAGAAVVQHEQGSFHNHQEQDQIDDATAREQVLH